jgi:hypothetical protein
MGASNLFVCNKHVGAADPLFYSGGQVEDLPYELFSRPCRFGIPSLVLALHNATKEKGEPKFTESARYTRVK